MAKRDPKSAERQIATIERAMRKFGDPRGELAKAIEDIKAGKKRPR